MVWVSVLDEADLPIMTTITVTIADPAVISWAAHGFSADQAVAFTTTGVLPTELVAGTTYYVSATGLGTDEFQVSATAGGDSIVTTGEQSGVHSGYVMPVFPYTIIPESGATVCKTLSVTMNGEAPGLEPISIRDAESTNDDWRTTTGSTEYFVEYPKGVITPVPLPSALASFVFTVAYEPSSAATTFPDILADDWLDEITSGALAKLCALPKKPWTDYDQSKLHAGLFNDGVDAAKVSFNIHRVLPTMSTAPSQI